MTGPEGKKNMATSLLTSTIPSIKETKMKYTEKTKGKLLSSKYKNKNRNFKPSNYKTERENINKNIYEYSPLIINPEKEINTSQTNFKESSTD